MTYNDKFIEALIKIHNGQFDNDVAELEQYNKIFTKEAYEAHLEYIQDHRKGKKLNLNRSDLRDAYLHNVDLSYANLSFTDLRGADLRKVNLYGADLSHADLHRADLSNVNLYGSNLNYADLSMANLSMANLCSAKLCGTDLRGADLRFEGIASICIEDLILTKSGYIYLHAKKAASSKIAVGTAGLLGLLAL